MVRRGRGLSGWVVKGRGLKLLLPLAMPQEATPLGATPINRLRPLCVCVNEAVARLGVGLIGVGQVAPPPPGGPAPNRPRPHLIVCV